MTTPIVSVSVARVSLFALALLAAATAANAAVPAPAAASGAPVAGHTGHGPEPGSFVPSFRLTDHLGVTRELFYESKAKAVVVVFTAVGSARATQTAAALQAMRARFSAADVIIWQIDSNLGADRAVIAADAALVSGGVPILVDNAQLVAGAYHVERELQTLVIKPVDWTLMYRGPLDNADPATASAPTLNLASDAVASLIAGQPIATPSVAMSANAPLLDLPPARTPDYAAEVAPIVLRSCVQCHTPGNIAPFVFANHTDLKNYATQIRSSLLGKRMTPWHADQQYGVFANTTALTPAEISTLFTWIAAGAPRGTAPDPLVTTPPAAGVAWPLGTPDLIVSIPNQSLPATGVLAYRYLTVAVPLDSDKWLRAAVVKPGNVAAVHHALIFEGTLIDVIANSGGLGGFFAGYVPGMAQTWFPEGSGKRLRKGTSVTFQMHYTTTGAAGTDQTQLGFYFADAPPEREMLTKSAFTTSISIAPGEKEYPREATFMPSPTKDVMLYELNPHMHYRGKRVKYEALYPNGSSEVLLNVPQYDFHWQSQYRLAQPKRLPAGTVIRVRGAFDNSAQNPDNPNPAAAVGFGEQTTDEMFVGYINYAELPATAAAAPVFAGNTVARARVGQSFSFAVPAANTVAGYRADALPDGLALDAATGVISGTPQTAGRRSITIFADNASGSAAAQLDLTVTAALGAPVIATQPATQTTTDGGSATFSVEATGAAPLAYQWLFNGLPVAGATSAALAVNPVSLGSVGEYSVRVTNDLGASTSQSALLGVTASAKVIGAGAEVGPNIVHANGNVYDQVLLTGAAAAVTADPGQIVRISYVDLNDDIVQVEFAGAGTLTLRLDGASGPAAPLHYNQPTVAYMKGHASIVIAGATETTNVSVFSVGRATAFNQALFKAEVTYDGLADVAFVAIGSANGKFGGVRTANANYFATKSLTGVYAPNAQFTGPLFVGDVSAFDAATPVLRVGATGDARITGGDLAQANSRAVQVSGITQLAFTGGSTSHGVALPAQANKGRLEQNGVDVTTDLVSVPMAP